ncbi:MAG: hypothetical protein KDB90_16005 [Planctomycetes bacterium]|nr:hypothetical protein [Planctomycetota bacterium]
MGKSVEKRIHPLVALAVVLFMVFGVLGMGYLNSRNSTENYSIYMGTEGCRSLAELLRQRQIDGPPITRELSTQTLTGDADWTFAPTGGRYTIEMRGDSPQWQGTSIRFESKSKRSSATLTVTDLAGGRWSIERSPAIKFWEVWR